MDSGPTVTSGPCVSVNGGSVGATSVAESAGCHGKLLELPGFVRKCDYM